MYRAALKILRTHYPTNGSEIFGFACMRPGVIVLSKFEVDRCRFAYVHFLSASSDRPGLTPSSLFSNDIHHSPPKAMTHKNDR